MVEVSFERKIVTCPAQLVPFRIKSMLFFDIVLFLTVCPEKPFGIYLEPLVADATLRIDLFRTRNITFC